MANIIWSIVWILILWFLMWPIAGLLASFWILFMPFEACFPCLKEINTTLLKWIQYCEKVGQNIKSGNSLRS
ncbi:unnamed protein product [Brachionus calyciflorus]|uniref:Uncharacterized protein n=1 Tax=Brachionus calyciflorus TaxID=104777 RepID=A0A814N3P3_9BILA|nr:unnamed protein product [Brachionus calyciflorus]